MSSTIAKNSEQKVNAGKHLKKKIQQIIVNNKDQINKESTRTEQTAAEIIGGDDDETDQKNLPVSSEEIDTTIVNNNQEIITTTSRRKMFFHYVRELLCILALVLTTYAALQNGPPKIGRPPPPVPFFAKGSVVQDWPAGHLNIVQNRVAESELSLVFFYAPWCAESQHARGAYESVAKLFYREIYFSAINCWQPGGECRLQYTKVHVWPVLMAYYTNGLAVQYHGSWEISALSKFVAGLLNPLQRISNPDGLLKLLMNHDAVIIGFFNSTELISKYQIFYKTAVKWLEQDPFQEVEFAVVTGESAMEFGVKTTPVIRMYLWNETVELSKDFKWTTEKLNKWITDRLHFVTAWLSPPGRKSSTLSPYLKDSPSLLFFTPRDYYTHNKDGYHLLKEVALDFFNCQNDTWVTEIGKRYIRLQRKENLKDMEILKAKCLDIYKSDEKKYSFESETCSSEKLSSSHVSFAYILNNSKNFEENQNTNSFCRIGPKAKNNVESSNVHCEESGSFKWRKELNENSDSSFPTSMLNSELDPRSPHNILESNTRKLCYQMAMSDKSYEIFFQDDNKNNNKTDDISVTGMACKYNRTMSLLLLDSVSYSTFAERLGINVLKMPKKSTVVIVDNENDSTYQLQGEITSSAVASFIKDYFNGNLPRKLRAGKRNSNNSSNIRLVRDEKKVLLREINSKEFINYTEKSNKTAVVLFYSTQCALCSIFSQTLLTTAKILETLNIDFFRIDGDKNDLQWHFTMDNYPTLIIVPHNRKSETRIFPQKLEVNVSHVLGFIIANLHNSERLNAMLAACRNTPKGKLFNNCFATFRKQISHDISFNLRHWRHVTHKRAETLRRLQILKKLYLFSLQVDHSCDLDSAKKDILYLDKLWPK